MLKIDNPKTAIWLEIKQYVVCWIMFWYLFLFDSAESLISMNPNRKQHKLTYKVLFKLST